MTRDEARRALGTGAVVEVTENGKLLLMRDVYVEKGERLVVVAHDTAGDPILATNDGRRDFLRPIFAEDLLRWVRIVNDGLFSHAHAAKAFNVAEFFDAKAAWSRETFGPGDRHVGVVEHIRRELTEILLKPSDLVEWVDVVLLAMDGAWRSAGANGERFVAAMYEKDQKNRHRSWPDWRTLKPDEVSEHHRADDMWNRPSLKRLRLAMRHAVVEYRRSQRPNISVGMIANYIDKSRQMMAFAIVIMQTVADEGSVPEKSVARYRRALEKLTKTIGSYRGDAL